MKEPRELPLDPPSVPDAEQQWPVDNEDQPRQETDHSISDLALAADLGSQRS